MFSPRMSLSVNYAIAIYSQLLSLSIPMVGICAAMAGLKLSLDSYIDAQGQLMEQSSAMVNMLMDKIVSDKTFDYPGGT